MSRSSQPSTLDAYVETGDEPNWKPKADENPDTGARVGCENCSSSVSKQFARVFGDNQNRVHKCRDCAEMPEVRDAAILGDSQ